MNLNEQSYIHGKNEIKEDDSVSFNLYTLFENESHIKLRNQYKIISSLEKNINFQNADKFRDLVHFQNSIDIPIQRWFPYREGYSTILVKSFLDELNISGNVFDPFCGSGTTQLASRQRKLNSFGIDVNPISILVAKVENETYTRKDKKQIEEIFKEFKDLQKPYLRYTTSYELANKTFNEDILESLLFFKSQIDKIEFIKIHDFFFVAWLAIIEKVSNIKKEGNGIKYKNRLRTSDGYINIDKLEWEEATFPEDKFSYVKQTLLSHLNLMIIDVKNSTLDDSYEPKFFTGNCLEFPKYFDDDIQLTFYSPPYCNCFDYFEIHKIELWLGGFVNSKEEFRDIRNTGFRSNVNSLNHKDIHYTNDKVESLINLLEYEKLWNKNIPKVIRGYFDDTHNLLTKLFNQTSKNGYVGIVVGNSAYTGIIIPSDIIIANIAREIGFKVENILITRHLTTSSQQKINLNPLKEYLRESIVVLKK